MSNIQIESDIKEILTRIENRFDRVDEKFDQLNKTVNEMNVRMAKVETKLDEGITPKIDALGEQIKEIKDTQKGLVQDVSDLKGAKSLIVPIVVAVTTAVLTVFVRSLPPA